MAINLSVNDLYAPDIVARIAGLFATWDIGPEFIQFELTESALMADPSIALRTLGGLKSLGIDIFIDDFGTGYSSLSYLRKLPVSGIKINQSFVTPMIQNADSAVIVRSIVELGHNLQKIVVAEGVEDQATWDSLVKLGWM